MVNIKLTLQYDGSDFSGYEIQPEKRTVRGELSRALEKTFGKKVDFSSTSRTDSGVHSIAQTISFKSNTKIPINKISQVLNISLPNDIRIIKAEKVSPKFNSRFSPKSKEYEYLIYNGEIMPPHLRQIAWHVRQKLNVKAVRQAAKKLVGKHDFSSFCASGGDDRNFERTLYSVSIKKRNIVIWENYKAPVYSVKIKGNGFLYKMVRNIVGTLAYVGLGKLKPEDIPKIIKAKDRAKAGITAPACGLCLTKVNF